MDEALGAVRVDTYYSYLDALRLCGEATKSLEEAMTNFASGVHAEVMKKTTDLDGRIYAINETMAPTCIALFSFGGIASLLVGFNQCDKARGFEASLAAFFGYSIGLAVLSAVVCGTGFAIWKATALAPLNSEKERLHRIDAEVAKIGKT